MNTFLKNNRVFILSILFLLFAEWMCVEVSTVTLDRGKQIVRHKRNWARQKHTEITATSKDVVLFFGDSSIVAGIIPEAFDATTQTTLSYNCALTALPLAPHYFLLKDYLRNNSAPRYIVMQLKTGMYEFTQPKFLTYAPVGASLFEVLQYALLGNNKAIIISSLPSRLYWTEVRRFLIKQLLPYAPESVRRFHKEKFLRSFEEQETFPHDLNYLYEADFIHPQESLREREKLLSQYRGYYYFIEDAALGGRLPADYKPKPEIEPCPQLDDPFIDLFFRLAEQHNINIILLPPYEMDTDSRAQQTCANEETTRIWRTLQQKYPHIYFTETGLHPPRYSPSLFSDPTHLNNEGAQRYSRNSARYFKEVTKGRR